MYLITPFRFPPNLSGLKEALSAVRLAQKGEKQHSQRLSHILPGEAGGNAFWGYWDPGSLHWGRLFFFQ